MKMEEKGKGRGRRGQEKVTALGKYIKQNSRG